MDKPDIITLDLQKTPLPCEFAFREVKSDGLCNLYGGTNIMCPEDNLLSTLPPELLCLVAKKLPKEESSAFRLVTSRLSPLFPNFSQVAQDLSNSMFTGFIEIFKHIDIEAVVNSSDLSQYDFVTLDTILETLRKCFEKPEAFNDTTLWETKSNSLKFLLIAKPTWADPSNERWAELLYGVRLCLTDQAYEVRSDAMKTLPLLIPLWGGGTLS